MYTASNKPFVSNYLAVVTQPRPLFFQVMLYFGLTLYALSTAVVVPCMTTLVSQYGDANQKGILLGVFRFETEAYDCSYNPD